jgi:UPF0271 protein
MDASLIPLVTSVNVACGAHAGDARTMARTVALAADLGMAVGAHPGYPDRDGFGRRDLDLGEAGLRQTLLDQVSRLGAICAARGVALTHVKPHGALYNRAALDPVLAAVVAEAVAAVQPGIALIGLPASALLAAASRAGLRPVAEAFADRAYEPDGSLRSRSLPDAVNQVPEAVAAQAVSIARDGRVRAVDGTWIATRVETLCLHGDTPGAVGLARAVREALAAAAVEVRAFAPS